MDARASPLFVRAEGSENLHQLSIELHRDEALTALVEIRHRFGFFEKRTLQSARGVGSETKEQLPDRLDEPAFKSPGREERDRDDDNERQQVVQNGANGAESEEQTEDHARRNPIAKRTRDARLRMGVVRVPARVDVPVAMKVAVRMPVCAVMTQTVAEQRDRDQAEESEQEEEQEQVHFRVSTRADALSSDYRKSLLAAPERQGNPATCGRDDSSAARA